MVNWTQLQMMDEDTVVFFESVKGNTAWCDGKMNVCFWILI